MKELRKSVKANVPTHKPEWLHESMNSSYITQLERKIRDHDNTIKLMESRLTQLEQKQHTPNTRDTTYCQHEYNPTQYHQHEYPRHQEFNCQLQHLTSNVREAGTTAYSAHVYQHNANYSISNATTASHVDQTTNNNTKYGKWEHSTSLWKLKPALQQLHGISE